jgi:hypothetical protein
MRPRQRPTYWISVDIIIRCRKSIRSNRGRCGELHNQRLFFVIVELRVQIVVDTLRWSFTNRILASWIGSHCPYVRYSKGSILEDQLRNLVANRRRESNSIERKSVILVSIHKRSTSRNTSWHHGWEPSRSSAGNHSRKLCWSDCWKSRWENSGFRRWECCWCGSATGKNCWYGCW